MHALVALTTVAVLMAPVAAQADAPADLAGSTWRGLVTVEAVSKSDGALRHSAGGDAEITLSLDEQGVLLFSGGATIDGRQAMRFDHALNAQDDGSWRSEDAKMEISSEGEISMQALNNGFVITAAGSMDATSLQLHLRTNGHEVQPDFVFVFDLLRETGTRSDRVDKCDHVVWQPRSLANPFGSAMSTIMVPVCIAAPRH